MFPLLTTIGVFLGALLAAAVSTLLMGLVVGYLGQRSRTYFIGGIRNFILIRDRHLLRLIAFGLTAWLALPVMGLPGGHRFVAHEVLDAFSVVLTILGWSLAYSRTRRRFVQAVVAFTLTTPSYLAAQAPPPMEIGGIIVSGTVRTRVESWDWFGDSPDGTYTYPGILARVAVGQTRPARDWQLEFSAPLVFALPDQPFGAGPAGLGANYFVANGGKTSAAMVFAKQAFVRFKDIGGIKGQSLTVGRMEFLDGTEASPTNGTLAALQRDRVSARLIANFGFTHVQRSLDGTVYALDRPATNVTLLAVRPTQGVFQVDGWGELNIELAYGAIAHQFGGATDAGQWRLFGAEYYDGRDGVVKTDSHSIAARQADHDHVNVATFGGNYLRAIDRGHGTIDVLFWGAAQIGAWGRLAHRASAFAAEAGWQPKTILAPWIRGGFDYGSGDDDPNDSSHGTFFQMLPTPRQYARFPFFNLMNNADGFVELMLRPARVLTIRTDVHALRLANGNDLWYQGGGAYQPATFGYVGQPVNGNRRLATLLDASADVTVTRRVTVTGYYCYAAGGSASSALYPTSNHAAFGYLELLVRF